MILKCLDDINSIWMICKVSRWSGKCPDDPSNVLYFVYTYFAKQKSRFFRLNHNWKCFLRTYVTKLTISLFRRCALSKKFLRGKSCYPESFRFFWLWLGADPWYEGTDQEEKNSKTNSYLQFAAGIQQRYQYSKIPQRLSLCRCAKSEKWGTGWKGDKKVSLNQTSEFWSWFLKSNSCFS